MLTRNRLTVVISTSPDLFFFLIFCNSKASVFLGFPFFVQRSAGKFFQYCYNSHPTIRVYILNSRNTTYRTHFLRRNRTLTLESVRAHNEEKVGIPSYLHRSTCTGDSVSNACPCWKDGSADKYRYIDAMEKCLHIIKGCCSFARPSGREHLESPPSGRKCRRDTARSC